MPFVEDAETQQRTWKPSKRQADFASLPDSVFEALYGGAAGGGKSELLLLLPILRQFHENARFHGIIFRRTFPELEESLIPRARDFYEPLGAKYNASKHFFRFPSGALFRLSFLESDDDARSHKSAEYNYVGFDELTEFSEYQYTYLLSRIRSASKDLPAFCRAASNPGSIGHRWVYERFVKPAEGGYALLSDKLSKTKRIFIPAKVADNPYLMENDPGYNDRLLLLPEQEQLALREGRWDLFAGQVFSEFRNCHHPGEPANAVHVIEPFDIPEWWPRGLAIDWGFTAATWAGWAALSPDNRIYVYREYHAKKERISTWSANIKRISQHEDISRTVLDPSAWQRRGEEFTIAEQFHQTASYWPEKADNDRLGGKMLMHDLLRWNVKPKTFLPPTDFDRAHADRLLRIGGKKVYNDYIALFKEDKPETNLPRIQIFNTCPVLIATIPMCVYAKRRPEDVEEFNGDDPYDGFRYLCKLMDSMSEPSEEATSRKKLQTILDDFQNDGDATRFYRRMQKHELADTKSTGVIRPSSFSKTGGRVYHSRGKGRTNRALTRTGYRAS